LGRQDSVEFLLGPTEASDQGFFSPLDACLVLEKLFAPTIMKTLHRTKRVPLRNLTLSSSADALVVPAPPITIRVGCRLVYQTTQYTPIFLVVRPRSDNAEQIILAESLTFRSEQSSQEFQDAHGNVTHRWTLPPGQTVVVHDALVQVSSRPDSHDFKKFSVPIEEITPATLRYTLPSRYCDSDKLLLFSAQKFGHLINGVDKVIAICNWVQKNINYVTCSGRPDLSASEVIARGYGVCRDFAHVAIALCRALNLPTRYVSGHLPDVGCFDPGTPMDFHAYFEVYLEHQWRVFDARFNVPRIGRVKVAHGLDAVDGSISTVYGQALLTAFQVWSYQVNPAVVSVGSPIDMTKRLDGTPLIRFA
jgi:transglutaminase-like putative cysteine protease